jgi:hypothetical protein
MQWLPAGGEKPHRCSQKLVYGPLFDMGEAWGGRGRRWLTQIRDQGLPIRHRGSVQLGSVAREARHACEGDTKHEGGHGRC